jgi:hypothetical protein
LSTLPPTVVAAIDFGTDSTGFAWCAVSPLNDDPMTRCMTYGTPPGGGSGPKDLTAILVGQDGRAVAWGHQARRQWVAAVDRGDTAGLGYAQGFKMALGECGASGSGPAAGGAWPAAEGAVSLAGRRGVRKLITAYLGEVRKQAVDEIGRSGYAAAGIRWCITVPAIWDDADKALMREAAAGAGFPTGPGRLLLAIEPEAAALYCYLRLPELEDGSGGKQQLGPYLDGTRFMVVDCGGGTVDISAYESSGGAAGPVALREIGAATGARIGSGHINHAFQLAVLPQRLGAAAMARLAAGSAADLLTLSQNGEQAVAAAGAGRAADGTPRITGTVLVDVPPAVWAGLDECTRARLTQEAGGQPRRLALPPAEVEMLLRPVTDAICAGVAEQLASMRPPGGRAGAAETIVLTGGLARSAWLRVALQHRFGDQHRILLPPDPALAVMEGAVHYAYNPAALVSRQSRYTYGFEIAEPWQSGLDSPMRKFRDSDGQMLCRGRYKIAVRRMEQVGVDEPFPFVIAPTQADQSELEVRLFRTRELDPRYVDEPGCEDIGLLTVDISDSVGAPAGKRPVHLLLYFGRSQIQVAAVSPGTQRKSEVTVDFERIT